MNNNRKPEKHSSAIGETIIGREGELSREELRRQMYERIANGHALASIEETARRKS